MTRVVAAPMPLLAPVMATTLSMVADTVASLRLMWTRVRFPPPPLADTCPLVHVVLRRAHERTPVAGPTPPENRARIVEVARAVVAGFGRAEGSTRWPSGPGSARAPSTATSRRGRTCSPRSTAVTSRSSSRPRRSLLAEHDPATAAGPAGSDRVADYAKAQARRCSPPSRWGCGSTLSAHSLGPIGDAMTALLDAGQGHRGHPARRRRPRRHPADRLPVACRP